MRSFVSARDRLSSFFHSVRFRLTLWFVLILAIVLVVFSIFIYLAQSRDLRLDAVGHMEQKFARIQAYFHGAQWQQSDLSPGSVPDNGSPLQEGDLLIFTDAAGHPVQDWGAAPAELADLSDELVSDASRRPELNVYQQTIPILAAGDAKTYKEYLFIVTPVSRGDALVGYLIIGSPSDLSAQLRDLTISLVLGSLGMLAVALVGGLWLADRAMRPVVTITRMARSIGESDLSRRINLRGRDELAELASTFDNMLTRLQAAFDRQRRFVADASHELRTPLPIINLESGRIDQDGAPSEDYQRALHIIHAESGRMTRLVNDLMTLARMDSGQAPLQFEDLDLSDVIVESVERMAPLAHLKQVTLEITDLPELPMKGDRQYLVQMASNLIENAIKYGSAGQTVHIKTRSYADEKGGRKASFQVADSGPGIPREHLTHLFDRFYRVDPARTHDSEEAPFPTGSGLGLSIVAWVVQAHGGEVKVESQVDQGSRFEVILPLEG
jgi:signal transduction histidine kinase